jgi:hypothetical protein
LAQGKQEQDIVSIGPSSLNLTSPDSPSTLSEPIGRPDDDEIADRPYSPPAFMDEYEDTMDVEDRVTESDSSSVSLSIMKEVDAEERLSAQYDLASALFRRHWQGMDNEVAYLHWNHEKI